MSPEEKARQKREKREIKLRFATRERHLDRHRRKLAAQRRADRYEITASMFMENGTMSDADEESHAARPFLAASGKEIRDLQQAFNDFDTDESGEIEAGEFQNLMYALGHTLSNNQAEAAVQAIDKDGSGGIGFDEFAQWWLLHAEILGMQRRSLASSATRLKLRVAMRKRQLMKITKSVGKTQIATRSLLGETATYKAKELLKERTRGLQEAKREVDQARANNDMGALAIATAKVEALEAAIESSKDAPKGARGVRDLPVSGFAALATTAGVKEDLSTHSGASDTDPIDGTPQLEMPDYSDTDSD